ncbi:MAG TPA: hypothetical protein VH370_24645 [Humisphaera sp.]|nr:hypothetical protein [Humisphaera sp.]
MKHKKREPQTKAKQRAVKQAHLAKEPSLPASQKQISQGRFPGETPLTGEDRPLNESGGKRQGWNPDAPAAHQSSGRPRTRSQGASMMPRPRRSSRSKP